MTNNNFLKIVKMIGATVMVIAVFIFGFVTGDGIRMKTQETQAQIEQNNVESSKRTEDDLNRQISRDTVKEFLISFYTKKELEENRNRYKPFMTDGLYRGTVAEEDEPVNQAYKGYVVDQVFEDASIYIDNSKKEVLATVKYKQTILATKNDYSKSLDQSQTETIKLSYVYQNNTLLVNTIEKMKLDKMTGTENQRHESIPSAATRRDELSIESETVDKSLESTETASTGVN